VSDVGGESDVSIHSPGPVRSGPADHLPRETVAKGYQVYVIPRGRRMGSERAKVPRFDGPVAVKMDIYLLKYGKEGDIDNMQKTILDALNGIAWSDDGQVFEVYARKHYVSMPQKERVQVTVTNYTPEKEVAGSA
jgi:Holliday junction resolvase RusA-like endonuclease